MKFKSLHEKAKRLDDLIDEYREAKGNSFVPMKNLQEIVRTVFPESTLFNFGLHKLVFRLRHKSHLLALKIGKSETIEFDHKVYKRMPADVRSVYFAKIFWHSKYCLLQEYGVEAEVPAQDLVQIRSIAGKYGLLDITCDNIRNVNGNLKIIDAGMAPSGLSGLWQTADFIKLKLPSPVRKAIRKSRLIFAVREK